MSPDPTGPVLVPKQVGHAEGDKGPAVEELRRYLHHYGCLLGRGTQDEGLPRPGGNPSVSAFDRATTQALGDYQAFKGLRVMGILDESTMADKALSRCGVPDIGSRDAPIPGRLRFSAKTRWRHTSLGYGINSLLDGISSADTMRVFAAAFAPRQEASALDLPGGGGKTPVPKQSVSQHTRDEVLWANVLAVAQLG